VRVDECRKGEFQGRNVLHWVIRRTEKRYCAVLMHIAETMRRRRYSYSRRGSIGDSIYLVAALSVGPTYDCATDPFVSAGYVLD